MTKQHRHLIFVTFLISCVSLGILLISISTTNWVLSNPKCVELDIPDSNVNYGLFTGLYNRILPTPDKYSLTMICLYEHNICGLSCRATESARKQEFEELYKGQKPKFDCKRYRGYSKRSLSSENNITIFDEKRNDLTFINNGVHFSTILFLTFAIISSTICCIITVMNLTSNPVQTFLNIFGLYIWHSITSTSILIVILLWGIHFATTITHNVGLRDTIVQQWTSDGRSFLGYSYWILFASMLLHLINIGILFFRQHLINKTAPTIAAPNVDNSDGTIFLY